MYKSKRWVEAPLLPPQGWVPLPKVGREAVSGPLPPAAAAAAGAGEDNGDGLHGSRTKQENARLATAAGDGAAVAEAKTGTSATVTAAGAADNARTAAAAEAKGTSATVTAARAADNARTAAAAAADIAGEGERVWRGGRVAPLAANVVVVLYQKQRRAAEVMEEEGVGLEQAQAGGSRGDWQLEAAADGEKGNLPPGAQHRGAREYWYPSAADHDNELDWVGNRGSAGAGGDGGNSGKREMDSNWKGLGTNTWLGSLMRTSEAAAALSGEEYLVRVAWNEEVVQLPGCGGAFEVPLGVFLERVVGDKVAEVDLGKMCGWPIINADDMGSRRKQQQQQSWDQQELEYRQQGVSQHQQQEEEGREWHKHGEDSLLGSYDVDVEEELETADGQVLAPRSWAWRQR
jgi:hypothetical protein